MVITKITEQQKNKTRVNIYIDNKYSFSLSLQQVLDEGVKIGKELQEPDLEYLKKISDEGKLKLRTQEWLSLRPHSEKELRDYLRRKKVEPEQTEFLVASAKRNGYQNDESFAKWWVEQRRAKNKSQIFIRRELRVKGVEAAIIETAMQAGGDENASLNRLIQKKRTQTRYQDTQKLTAYLLRQGYRYSDIVEALAE